MPWHHAIHGAKRIAASLAVAAAASAALVALPVPTALARNDEALEIQPELDQGLLGEGRQAYRERADHDRARDAYRLFKRNYEQNPDDATAAWHLSMACYYLGLRVERDAEVRKAIHDEGRAVADRALAIDPSCGPCHLLSAVNHALWAEQVGIFRAIVGLPTVKSHLAQAARLDPTFAGAAALRVQATIAERLPRMFGGGKGKARRLIEQAIVVSPDEPLNYEVLANLLVSKYDDVPLALSVARRGLAVPEPAPEYVESRDSIAYLKRFVDVHSTLLSAR
jgi:tetratricopeptide (TPR) repeat protein